LKDSSTKGSDTGHELRDEQTATALASIVEAYDHVPNGMELTQMTEKVVCVQL
jgi:hypothetical protein